MGVGNVDEAIERYVNERMTKGAGEARQRFLSYAHLRYTGGDLMEFLRKTSGILQYNIDYLRVMRNPLKGPELAFLATILTMGAYGAYLAWTPDEHTIGLIVVAGALVNGWTVVRNALRKWCDLNVLIAIYRELVQLAEQEMGASGQPV